MHGYARHCAESRGQGSHCVQNEHHEGEADDVDARAAEVHTVPSGSPVAVAAVAASVTPVASSSVSVSGSAGLFL